jgi:hypothetical protein
MDDRIPRTDAEAAAMGYINVATYRMRLKQSWAADMRGEGGNEPVRKILTDADAINAGYPNLLS